MLQMSLMCKPHLECLSLCHRHLGRGSITAQSALLSIPHAGKDWGGETERRLLSLHTSSGRITTSASHLKVPRLVNRAFHVSPSCMSSVSKTHYEVLGLGKDATSDDIRAAFLKRSKECHPDLNRSHPDNHRLFVQVNEAYSVLSRPQDRKHYDLALDRQAHSSHVGSRPPPPHSSHYYHHPRDFSAEDWLKNSGLKEEYFRHSSNHQHYGKASLNKISNFHIVASCMVFMMVGIVFHIVAVKRSSEKHISILNDRDLRTHELWTNAKRAAKEFTPTELTQHLIDKQESQREQPRR